jgi:hypothetical protein
MGKSKQTGRQGHREREREENQSKPIQNKTKQNREKQKFDAHNNHVFSRNPSQSELTKDEKAREFVDNASSFVSLSPPIVVADPTIASLALSLSFPPSDFARKDHRRLLAATCPPACPSGKNKLVVLRIRVKPVYIYIYIKTRMKIHPQKVPGIWMHM